MTLLFQSPFYLPSSPKIRGSHSKSYFKNILLWVYLAHAMTEKKKKASNSCAAYLHPK